MDEKKLRTIITQDAEVDDQNSLRHFLFYANEVELQGIVQTSSKFHWRGIAGTAATAINTPGELLGTAENEDYTVPYRWTGTDWMAKVIDDYAVDYPNLLKVSPDYPTPDYLRTITKVGNVGYKGEIEAPSEGSELIRKAMLDDDPRPLYIQIWGGCNTIVRALMDIQAQYETTPEWPALYKKLTEKVIFTACGEQDETYRTYLAEVWPGMQFVKTLQMGSYAYPWPTMPEGESKDTLGAAFMRRHILTGKSALTNGYRTWLDGVYYEGEEQPAQFGANPNIGREWFGARFGLPAGEPFAFLSEGDSPTYFPLLNWGFRTLENFGYGGISGRYVKLENEVNSKGQPLNYWDVCREAYTDRQGNTTLTESMWRYVADIQRDFAARVAWAAGDTAPELAPTLTVAQGLDLTAAPGQTLTLHTAAACPTGCPVAVTCRPYPEAGTLTAPVTPAADGAFTLTLPADAKPGDTLHLIFKAQNTTGLRLVHYAQAIVTVQ